MRYSPEIEEILSKPTMTVDQFRIVMGIGRNQAYKYVREGRIASIVIGERKVILTSAVNELLTKGV